MCSDIFNLCNGRTTPLNNPQQYKNEILNISKIWQISKIDFWHVWISLIWDVWSIHIFHRLGSHAGAIYVSSIIICSMTHTVSANLAWRRRRAFALFTHHGTQRRRRSRVADRSPPHVPAAAEPQCSLMYTTINAKTYMVLVLGYAVRLTTYLYL